ncbi:unnamed protein product [Prorocentrum cordatum]|uniref:Uncharacterized protein n=1 Tax=Prorocentrum cordatum TaxID=2364126 RepID=A0ABN9W776_9DINO|nr:unnamed protein product [Polarella glacialis]CAK0882016.1 unnamed protein product [Polarella glacialis]
MHFGHLWAAFRMDYSTNQPDVPQLPTSLVSPVKAACDSDDASSESPKRVSEAALLVQGPSTCAPGESASQTVWTTPPSTPRVRSGLPAAPPSPQFGEPRAEPLLLALERNCTKQVRLAIEADPEAAKEPFWDSRFEWPLCAAIRLRCSVEVVRLLIENGAEVGVESVGGQSPLQLLSTGTEDHLIDLRRMSNTQPGAAEWIESMRQSTAQFELGVATALLNAGADPAAHHGDPRMGSFSSQELARRSGKDHLTDLYEAHDFGGDLQARPSRERGALEPALMGPWR